MGKMKNMLREKERGIERMKVSQENKARRGMIGGVGVVPALLMGGRDPDEADIKAETIVDPAVVLGQVRFRRKVLMLLFICATAVFPPMSLVLFRDRLKP